MGEMKLGNFFPFTIHHSVASLQSDPLYTHTKNYYVALHAVVVDSEYFNMLSISITARLLEDP